MKKIDETLTIELIDGGEIYQDTREGKLLGNEKLDWNTSFKDLKTYLNDNVLDNSKTNAQSAIIIARCNGKKFCYQEIQLQTNYQKHWIITEKERC